ncbi:hypothetical protein ACIOJD_12840 [Streptomyces sp. NPDC088116]|uniref:hypothetical protein n=1 Tax=Streptomyces sp. NPDC088116 TaxID=3365825 RepID=UPI003822F2DE
MRLTQTVRSRPTRSTATAPTMPTRGGALRASGLPAYWARQYSCLRDPDAAAAAETHVNSIVKTLPLPYRLGFTVVLRLLPTAFRLVTGARLERAPARTGRKGMARLGALPGFAEVVRASTTLALYGALDGLPVRERPGGGPPVRNDAPPVRNDAPLVRNDAPPVREMPQDGPKKGTA